MFAAFALCGLLAGVAGVMWVIEFGTINGTSANGVVLAVVAAVVVGGVNIFGGSGSVAGAAIGAIFLGFVANALILVGLSQFWLQAIYGVVILVAVERRRAASRGACRGPSPRAAPDEAARSLVRWEVAAARRAARDDRVRHADLAGLPHRPTTSRTCSPP